jgi:hypothetical protein
VGMAKKRGTKKILLLVALLLIGYFDLWFLTPSVEQYYQN